MNNSQKMLALARATYRQFSKTAVAQGEAAPVNTAKLQKLKEIQKKFGVDDNVPVHLKGGLRDKILYQTTFALTMLGIGMSLETFYRLSFGKAN